jgi:cyclopropane-fatty-acyl-phospholipid synthase
VGGEARVVASELLRVAGIEIGGERPFDIVVHDERLWERLLRDRGLGLGESYMDGWWDSGALDDTLTRIIVADLRSQLRITPKLAWQAARSSVLNRQRIGRAAANASHHYDIGNDLYERMLDPRMVYSCAYWRRPGSGEHIESLNEAQEAKLELVCQKIGLERGMTLLDIGVGWGGFARYAAERYEVKVVGVTPAVQQATLARERCFGLPVEIRQQDYRHVEGRFDRIVSIGMMEHVGPKNLATFFDVCGRVLTDDGVMLHHTIGSNVTTQYVDAWFDRYIFPGGVLPSISQLGRATEGRWVVEDLHNFGPDYDRTLLVWHRNIEAAWPELPGYDERFRRMWRYYLLCSAAAFRSRNLQLWQLVMRRVRPSGTYRGVR